MATTGTVYALVDPRDGVPRYIGETERPLKVRMQGHMSAKKGKVPPWIAELRALGLRPQIVPLRENVPVGELLAAEREEITRIIVAGGELLNEQATATGRKLNQDRLERERAAAQCAGWRELAEVARAALGGPVPPGRLRPAVIPDITWQFMATVRPDHKEHLRSLLGHGLLTVPPEQLEAWRVLNRAEENAVRELTLRVKHFWWDVRDLSRDALDDRLERCASMAVGAGFRGRAVASRWLSLAVWSMVAVDPWRHLAEIAGLPADGPDFIAWAGTDPGTREALESVAKYGDVLAVTPLDRNRWYDENPGCRLGAMAAAYTGTQPAAAITFDVVLTLGKMARDRQLTSPLAALLLRLDPKALDTAYGKDVSAEMDAELGLPAGTSGRVVRALAARIGRGRGESIHNIADRSAQELPTVAVPDYAGWNGRGIPGGRVMGASLVHAGLAVPDHGTAAEYMANVRRLWAPRPDRAWRAA